MHSQVLVLKGGSIIKLTKSQIKGIGHLHGNALLNSGGGSGKTSVFIARIGNLIANEGVDPTQILGLTFTNEAAQNMKDKLATKIGKDKAKTVSLSTFHSFAYRIMRQQFPDMYKGKQIVQQWWKMQTASEIVDLTDGLGLGMKPGEFLGFVSYQKSNLVRYGADIIVDSHVAFALETPKNKLSQAYDRYLEMTKHARVYDFDDMLMDFYYKLQEESWLVDLLKRQYKYIMVDEFQDTSSVNMRILKLISDNNLFVVGDFRQGIYGFINANIDNILNFAEEFPDTTLIELRENFRSTKNIVNIINDVIEASPNEKYKEFKNQISGRSDEGEPIKVSAFNHSDDEVNYVCNSIEDKYNSTDLEYKDFAIICRTNAELGMYESVMAEKGIPVKLSSNKSFFDRKEIADVLAYAAHALDEFDDMSMRRIYNTPNRFVPKKAISTLSEYAYNNKVSLEDAVSLAPIGRSRGALQGLVRLFNSLRVHLEKPADVFLKTIIDKTSYMDHIDKRSATPSELVMRKEAIGKLIEMASRFNSIGSFLTHIEIIKNNAKKDKDAVNIMTTHASKGLEFDTVFVTNANETSYPHSMSMDSEEERRLLYVAMSRAINTLEVSYSQMSGIETHAPSPFLVDIAGDELKELKSIILGGETSASFYYKSKIEVPVS